MEEATKIHSNSSAALKSGQLGYPTQHLGHLTTSQESALTDFKKLCIDAGLYKPGSGDDQPPSHRDAVLLRFLRARRFVPKDALQQFRDTENWRKVNEIDELYANIDIDNYNEARRLYPQWVGRRDKRGMPLYLFEVKTLDSKTMAAYAKSSSTTAVANTPSADAVGSNEKPKNHVNAKESTVDSVKTPPRLLRLFALYENLSGFMSTLCTVLPDRPHSETPIVQANNIVDISGVGLKQFWNLRSHMQDASVLATAHYPETLDRIFIVGAPSFFPTVWSWIKRWFDPITVSKIFILGPNDIFPTLSKFIEPENIPRKYGGTLDFSFGQLPSVDPAYADKIEWKYPIEEETEKSAEVLAKSRKADPKRKGSHSEAAGADGHPTTPVRRWPRGPVRWIERPDGDLDFFAVGSEHGKLRREVIATLRLGGNVGGSADPTGPLQAKNENTLASEKAEPQENSTNGALTNGSAIQDLPEAMANASLANEASAANAETNGQAKEEVADPPKNLVDPGAVTTVEAAAIATTGSDTAIPPTGAVPLDAVATALPDDSAGRS